MGPGQVTHGHHSANASSHACSDMTFLSTPYQPPQERATYPQLPLSLGQPYFDGTGTGVRACSAPHLQRFVEGRAFSHIGDFSQYTQPQCALPHVYTGMGPALPFPGLVPATEMTREIIDMKTCVLFVNACVWLL